MRKENKGHHITEAYDHMLPEHYKSKEFSRQPKSNVHAKPNHLGDTLRQEHEHNGDYTYG